MVVTTSKLLPDAIRYYQNNCSQPLNTRILAAAHRGTVDHCALHAEGLTIPSSLSTCKSSLLLTDLPSTLDACFLVGSDCGAAVVTQMADATMSAKRKLISSRVYSVSARDEQFLIGLDGGKVLTGRCTNAEGEIGGLVKARVLQDDAPVQLSSINPSGRAILASDKRNSFQISAVRAEGPVCLYNSSDRNRNALKSGSFEEEKIGEMAWSPTCSNLWAKAIKKVKTGDSLLIHDLRVSFDTPVLTYENSLKIASNPKQIAWNPFVPYWLGMLTTSNTDSICIFDMRCASGPMMQLTEYSKMTCFAWSNNHVELLMTASTDRSISQWSLKESMSEDYHDGIRHRLAHRTVLDDGDTGALKVLIPSHSSLDTYIGLSMTGKMARVSFDTNASIDGADNCSFKAIEDALYARRFDRVYPALLELSNTLDTIGEFRRLQDLTNRTFPSLPIPLDSWTIGSETEKDCFYQDLDRLSYTLPPGLEIRKFVTADQMLHQNAVANVRLKVLLLDLVERRDLVAIQVFLPKLISAMKDNANFLQASLLYGLLRVLLDHDRLLALKFVRDLVLAIFPSRLDNAACELVHLALYPTIFDDAGAVQIFHSKSLLWQHSNKKIDNGQAKIETMQKLKSDHVRQPSSPPAPTAQPNLATHKPLSKVLSLQKDDACKVELRKCLRSQKHTLSLLNLDISYETILRESFKSSPTSLSEWIFKTFQSEEGGGLTISCRPLFAYMHLTLHHGLFGEYFELAGHLCRHVGGESNSKGQDSKSELVQAILEHAKVVVLPRLQYVLAQSTNRPQLAVKALTLIVKISVYGIEPVPVFMVPLLKERLKSITQSLLLGESSSAVLSPQPCWEELKMILASIPRTKKDQWRSDELLREIMALRARLVASSPVTSPQ